jgi:phosphopantetheinyl transferase (holo-ACP synthase)
MPKILKSYSAAFALKGGNVELLREFLEALLNRKIQGDDEIRLSSAQTARVVMWAEKNNVMFDLVQIRQNFSLSSLELSSSNSYEKRVQRSTLKSDYKLEIIRIGNDIQLVAELFPEEESLDSLKLEEMFTKYEIAYAKATDNPKVTLAGLFSLKESLVKAGASYGTYLDLEITHDNHGAPIFYGFTVSISHSGNYASSVALKIS